MKVRLSIRGQLLFGFAAILGLLLMMLLVSTLKMADIQDQLGTIMDNRYPKVEESNRLMSNMQENSTLLLEAMQKTTPEEASEVLARMDNNIRSNTATFESLEKSVSTPEGLALLTKINQDRVEVRNALKELIPHIRTNNHAEAQMAYQRFSPVMHRFLGDVTAFAKYQTAEMYASKTLAETQIQSARQLLLGLGVLSLLVGLAIAMLFSARMSRTLGLAVRLASKIADGDFSASGIRTDPDSRDEIQQLLLAQETMRLKLADAMNDIRSNATRVAQAAQQLSGVSHQVADSVQRQADATASAAATLEELTVSINHVSDSAADASHQAHQAGDLASRGSADVSTSVNRIDTVRDNVAETASEIDSLTHEVQAIGNIVTVIRDVADQTNLLALNAAIEAARAGETGRGFAVVADEVRKLAERTTVSAQEITRMISSIQQNAGRVVTRMEQSRHSVDQVTDSATRSNDAMQQVQHSASAVLGAISHINSALTEQRNASQGLACSMESVARMAEDNNQTVGDLAASSRQLQTLSDSLQGVVSRFRL